MRTGTAAVLLMALAGAVCAQGDRDKKVAEQKKQGETAWKSLEAGDPSFVETKHLLVFAPKAMDKQLKAKAATLEKYHEHAVKAAGLDVKEGYSGKILVYLLPDDGWPTFARRVEKRRPMSGESASFKAADDMLHAAASPAGKVPVEARAGEMLAALILQRKAVRGTQLPDWLIAGFGRATSYQVLPREKFVLDDRKQSKALAKKKDASAIWGGTLEEAEAGPLQGSLAEFLAYTTGGRKYFAKIVAGFAPGENMATKTTPQALEAAGLTAEKVAKSWKNWATK
jgi:hypothetical protein